MLLISELGIDFCISTKLENQRTTKTGRLLLLSIPFDTLPRNWVLGQLCPLAPITIMSNLFDFAKFVIVLTMSFDVNTLSSNSIPCLAAKILPSDINFLYFFERIFL